ncbi:MAG: UDP-N-acetylmuramoyl-tripeptide--D-alanyl-D-alanine ligase [Gammaproteobacteria bacterium]
MSMGTLSMVADAVDGRLIGADRSFAAVSTDTRTLQTGELFFALHGDRYDAAEFVAEAARRGAAGAVVDGRQQGDLPQIEVGDTRDALGALARTWRGRFELPVIGVTGSNGKTTVKEMIAAILRAEFDAANGDSAVLVTSGNFNNEVGLPLTVLRLEAEHRAAIFEMGAARPKDIEYLADIAAPTIGVVTNAGKAHLEGFGNEETVAATKGELFEALARGDVAVVNHDDKFASFWRELAAPAEIRTFGLTNGATYKAVDIREIHANESGIEFTMQTPGGEIAIRLPMAGRHNVANALAAAAAADAAGASAAAIRVSLAGARNIAGRLMELSGVGGVVLFDDSYNANPVSVAAAIDFLAERAGETWLILGDMAELGPDGPGLHHAAGERAHRLGVDRLFTYGALARNAAAGFGVGATTYDDLDTLAAALRGDAHAGVSALVKGSRCMGLDRLVALLREDEHVLSGSEET